MVVAGRSLPKEYDVDGEVGRIWAVRTRSVLPTDVARIPSDAEDVIEGGRGKRGFCSMKLVRDLQRRSEAVALGHARSLEAYAGDRNGIE